MVSLTELIQRHTVDTQQGSQHTQIYYYQCQQDVNIYDSPQLKDLATQAATARQLRILSLPLDAQGQLQHPLPHPAIPVCLYEDDYPGWLALDDLSTLRAIDYPSPIPTLDAEEIRDRIPQIITYMTTAMAQPNEYLWGGVIGPNYDCSGLMQAAFRSQGIWLPRDGYQQEAFVQPVDLNALEMGDLIFFGPKERANHVALYLGESRQNGNAERRYIHSSGKSMGRNGIGIDRLPPSQPANPSNTPPLETDALDDPISQAYANIVHGAGRVIASYHPRGIPIKSLDETVIPMT